MSDKTKIMVEGTLAAALAFLLSLVPTNLGSSFTISLGMVPMTVYALRRGAKPALFASFVWGILHFLLGTAIFLTVVQVLIEYPVAFTFAGVAGMYEHTLRKGLLEKNRKMVGQAVLLASFVGTGARFFWHFIAGGVFWGSYALWGMDPWLFSFVLNGVSGLATAVVTAFVLLLFAQKAPQLFLPKK